MVRLHSCPNGDLNEDLTAKIDEKICKKSDGMLSYKKLADKLISAKLSCSSETKLKEPEGIPWPLHVRSMHCWSSKTVKNAKWDIPKHALMALVETLVVEEHYLTLLCQSTAARSYIIYLQAIYFTYKLNHITNTCINRTLLGYS